MSSDKEVEDALTSDADSQMYGGSGPTAGLPNSFVETARRFGVEQVQIDAMPPWSAFDVVLSALANLSSRKIRLPRNLEFKAMEDESTAASYFDTGDRLVINAGAEFWKAPHQEMRLLAERRYLVSADPRAIIYHEVGHAQHRSRYRWGWRWWRVSSRKLTGEEQRLADRVSLYASADAGEFVAETFAGLLVGHSFDDAVMALYRRLRGPIP